MQGETGQTRRAIRYVEPMAEFGERLTMSLRKKHRIEKGDKGGD